MQNLSSWTGGGTRAPCSGSAAPWPLALQGSPPPLVVLIFWILVSAPSSAAIIAAGSSQNQHDYFEIHPQWHLRAPSIPFYDWVAFFYVEIKVCSGHLRSHKWQRILPPMQEMQEIWFPGREDPLKEEMAPHSSILAWKIPWAEEPGQLPSIGSQRVGHDWAAEHTQKCSFLLLLMGLGCLQFDSITDHTARSLCQTCVPGSQVSGPHSRCTFQSLRNSRLFSKGVMRHIPPRGGWAPTPHHAPRPSYICSDRCTVIPHPGLSCISNHY